MRLTQNQLASFELLMTYAYNYFNAYELQYEYFDCAHQRPFLVILLITTSRLLHVYIVTAEALIYQF